MNLKIIKRVKRSKNCFCI